MKSLTSNQIRHRLGKCADSVYKNLALRSIRIAGVAARQNNKVEAETMRDYAQYYLQYAEIYIKKPEVNLLDGITPVELRMLGGSLNHID